MSFFGFDTTLPRDKPRTVHGFSAPDDAFAGLSAGPGENEAETYVIDSWAELVACVDLEVSTEGRNGTMVSP